MTRKVWKQRQSWSLQLQTCRDKGQQAGLDGLTRDANPYATGYRNQNGTGGSLQQQRRWAWHEGFMLGVSQRTDAPETPEKMTDAERQLYGALQAFYTKQVAV